MPITQTKSPATSKPTARDIALAMLAQVEHQSGTLLTGYGVGDGIADRFVDFHAFIGQLEHFQLFAELTESRLEDLGAAEAAELQKLLGLRWRMMQLELQANRIFLEAMAASGRPWPLGSKSILHRRLARLGEIAAFHDEHGKNCNLAAPDPAVLKTLRDRVKEEMGHSLALHDFRLERMPAPANREPPKPADLSKPVAKAAAKPVAKSAAAATKVGRLEIRQDDGYVYIGANGLNVVGEACRAANISLDDLAEKMEVSRPSLVLILNGRDPANGGMLAHLRKFVSHNGGSIAA